MRFAAVGLGVLLASLATALEAKAAAPEPPVEPAAGLTIERLDWSGPAEPSTVVVVENDYGDVRVRGTEGDAVVEVHTVVQRLDSAGEKLALTVERAGTALVVRIAYPPQATPDPAARAKRERLDRADLVVFVPDDVRLEARTRKGLVQVSEFEGDVEAETASGEIRVVAERSVRARTTSGPVHLLFREGEAGKPMWVETDSGSIELELAAEADLDVHTLSGGKIDLGYPAKVESKHGVNRASFVLGKGEQTLLVRSKSGSVRVAPAPR